jgi:hypothetical protein
MGMERTKTNVPMRKCANGKMEKEIKNPALGAGFFIKIF